MEIKIKTAQRIPLSRIAGPSRLDEHSSFIAERLRVGVPIAQIARDLTRAKIVVPYNTLWEFAVKLRGVATPPVEEIRFESPPAQQAQCDWADFGTIVEDGGVRALSLFVMVLGFSRHTFGCFASTTDEISLQRCHVVAFDVAAFRARCFTTT